MAPAAIGTRWGPAKCRGLAEPARVLTMPNGDLAAEIGADEELDRFGFQLQFLQGAD